MSTKKLISDSVLFKMCGGYPTKSFPVQEQDVWNALDNQINALFKLRHFDTTLPSGETMPENSMIATYEDVAVTSLGDGRASATLPITPISLPRNMGIYIIYDPNHPDSPFIPLQRGQSSLLNSDALLNELGGQIGFEPKNNKIIFRKDITTFGVDNVTMELCVLDISSYGVTDELPIPSDYISVIEDELMKDFAPVLAKNGIVSNFTNQTQQPSKQ